MLYPHVEKKEEQQQQQRAKHIGAEAKPQTGSPQIMISPHMQIAHSVWIRKKVFRNTVN